MKIPALALGTIAMATAAALGQQARPQAHARLQVKTGLWEKTITNAQQGAMPLPDSVLSHMSPEQRARVEARMRAKQSTTTHQACLTDKDLDDLTVFEKPDPNCKPVSQTFTATEVDSQWECKLDDGITATGTLHVDILDSENANGTLHVVANGNGRQMVRDSKMTYKWLGSDCSKIHNEE